MKGDQTLQVFDGRVFKSGVNWSVNAKATTFKEKNTTGATREIQGAKIILKNTQAKTTDTNQSSSLSNQKNVEILADDKIPVQLPCLATKMANRSKVGVIYFGTQNMSP
ncbi:WxL domain-containing protein [Lactococcus laudensis]|uniref:WxL domain-containing protein n=1 Tax=Pseudolactococcus laudensis TaxID=1494461 RepID=UPI00058DB03F